MNGQELKTIGILALVIYLMTKDLLIPLVKKRLNQDEKEKESNPINVSVFYQEFKDFKDEMCRFKERIKEDFEKLELQVDKLRNRRK